jgi:hypothetical protein
MTAGEQQKPNRDRAALAVSHVADPGSLIGSFFHGQGDKFNQHQGCVVAEPAPGIFLCEFYSWLAGEPTNQQLVPIAEMAGWLFYDDAEWMNNAYNYGGVATRWGRESKEREQAEDAE